MLIRLDIPISGIACCRFNLEYLCFVYYCIEYTTRRDLKQKGLTNELDQSSTNVNGMCVAYRRLRGVAGC